MKEGIYEQIVNNKLKNELDSGDYIKEYKKLDNAEAKILLSQYISEITKKALSYLREGNNADESLAKKIKLCNEIIEVFKQKLEDEDFEKLKIDEKAEVLTCAYKKINEGMYMKRKERTEKPFSQISLFTGEKSEPSMLEELKREISSADEILMIVSFLKWSGFLPLRERLIEYTNSGRKLKVITTSYMHATDFKVVDEISKMPNTEIKISYDVNLTRLHAKSYIFKRNTGFSTAYVGSSNMSKAALTNGTEWNVKLTEKDSLEVLKKVEATFETYWNSSDFVEYTGSEEDKKKLKEALTQVKGQDVNTHFLDIHPYTYQKEMLENLESERQNFGRYRNLLVAATGVGKTVVSAFDFKYFLEKNKSARLLFIAHRKEILEKSLETFRYILKDQNFGELLIGGNEPDNYDNLFASIDSLNSKKLITKTPKEFYDYIVIDEAHHIAAESYQKIVNYYEPKILLGLTATPERMDGKDIEKYFGHTIASEMRLPEAIDNKLLCPFQYYGVTDTVDLSELSWTRGGYEVSELENVYVINKEIANKRANNIIAKTIEYVADINDVKGIGFCVSVKHAEFMSSKFNEAKIDSMFLTGNSSKEERDTAIKKLKKGEVKFIFTVDLYNEGVDIPEINTVLFLRPTESLTIFLQQLGRGLRLCDGKEFLTVLDFIGQSRKEYVFSDKFSALTGKTRKPLENYVEKGFTTLPRGCYIQLEKQAKEYVLRNIKNATLTTNYLVNKIASFTEDTGKELTLKNFLAHYNINIKTFYKNRTFTSLKMKANIIEDAEEELVKIYTKRIPILLNTDSPLYIRYILRILKEGITVKNAEEKLLLNMLYYTFFDQAPKNKEFANIEKGLEWLFSNRHFKEELIEIVECLEDNINVVTNKNSYSFACPLEVHATYTQAQILAALGASTEESAFSLREGVKYFADKDLDIFFVTLNKSEEEYSETTLYEDYAISDRLFHWQSQSKTTQESSVGRRYLEKNIHGQVSLFVRENKKENGITSPYMYLGECSFVDCTGNKPVSIRWKLEHSIPAKFLKNTNKNIM